MKLQNLKGHGIGMNALAAKTRYLVIVISLCLWSVTSVSVTQGQGAAIGNNKIKESKVTNGKVGYINSKFIAIIDDAKSQDGYEYEQLMYVDEAVDVISKNSLDEIKVGDTVQIGYEKVTETSKNVTKSKDVAKTVKFLKAADTKGSSLKSGKK